MEKILSLCRLCIHRVCYYSSQKLSYRFCVSKLKCDPVQCSYTRIPAVQVHSAKSVATIQKNITILMMTLYSTNNPKNVVQFWTHRQNMYLIKVLMLYTVHRY